LNKVIPETEFLPPAAQFEKETWLKERVKSPFLVQVVSFFSCADTALHRIRSDTKR
jgi:hypothetical protein